MSLNFYTDSNLRNRVSSFYPKRFLVENSGGSQTSQLWLGDPYESTCSAVAHAGDDTLNLSDTSEFFSDTDIALMSGTIFSDNFERAELGPNWIVEPATAPNFSVLVSGYLTSNADGQYIWYYVDPSQIGHAVYAKAVIAGDVTTQDTSNAGISLNNSELGSIEFDVWTAGDGNAHWLLAWNNGADYAFYLNNFSISLGFPMQVGDTMELQLQGGNIIAKYKGVTLATWADASGLPLGQPGIAMAAPVGIGSFEARTVPPGSVAVGTAVSGSQQFTYAGKTQGTLTGVVGITGDIHIGDIVYPKVSYKGINEANISIYATGADFQNFGTSVQVGVTPTLAFQGLPAIFSQNSISIGAANALVVYLGVNIPAGGDREFTNFGLECNNLYKRDDSDTTPFSSSEGTYSPVGTMYAYRHDQSISISARVLPVNRQISPNVPGFIVGEYRWRGEDNRNATALIPTNWTIDTDSVGPEKFIAGFGDEGDLAPVGLVEEQDSIRMNVQDGEYFTGTDRYYLPAGWNLEFLPTSIYSANTDGTVTLTLQNTPRILAPRFVGTYTLDQQGFYEKSIEYQYMASLTNLDGSPRTDLPSRYYTLDRKNKVVTLNKSMGHPLVLLGFVSGKSIDYFDLPVYPVDNIDVVYIARGAGSLPVFAPTWSFDKEQGTIQVPSIPTAKAGEPVYAFCSPSVAVLYDSGQGDTRIIETVDFNPAFSGLANGYFYLQHRRQKPASLVLSCDKPRIAIPATQASVIGLVAYGPVYFENDYALLSVTAYSAIPGEVIPNAKLDVVVDADTFTGTINYQDPLTTTVSVITGGDGTANLIFVPGGKFGVWIPTIAASGGLGGVATTNIANDTLVLPTAVPISQIWNVQEGWLVTAYNIVNNNPLFGDVAADVSLGEIPWHTSGVPGGPDYRTNGERDAWRVGGPSGEAVVLPIDALDASGHSYTNASFLGTVKQLVYGQAVESGPTIGAYFITFVQRVLVQVKLENSDIYSNFILLQMDVPNLIVENPWLILDDSVQGRLNQFRLGYVRRT